MTPPPVSSQAPASPPPPPPPPGIPPAWATLVDTLLAEQQNLTAVERFSRHDRGDAPPASGRHRHLLPLSAPRPGEQYAFEVDLDRCSGCKACVTACHSLNGLDEGESWRSVGFLTGGDSPRAGALQLTVTTACHHCLEPACLLGCPVLAYDKDPATGIVRHLDDQCIGCSYCILKCPYEVPRFSARRGIVRKCDLCHGRLSEGEAPACAQACPDEAIRITLVPTAWSPIPLRPSRHATSAPTGPPPPTGHSPAGAPASADPPVWWADAPDPEQTRPTTRYRTRRPLEGVHAADHHRIAPADPHWPLALMLVLTQAGAGGLLGTLGSPGGTSGVVAVFTASGLVFTGLAASVLHLGQPAKAWRVWMGWRTSWLSREAVLLQGLALAAAGRAVATWRPDLVPRELSLLLPALLVVTTLAAVAAQVMVYVDTGRDAWRASATAPRFAGTTLLALAAAAHAVHPGPVTLIALGTVAALRLVHETRTGRDDTGTGTARRRTARLLATGLRPMVRARTVLLLLGTLLLALVPGPAGLGGGIAVLLLAEVAERHLFFTSMVPDRMPGLP